MSGTQSSALFALRDALREAGSATPEQLANSLQRPLPVVLAMLEHWARRGRVHSRPQPQPQPQPQSQPQTRSTHAPKSPAPAPAAGCGSGACSSCGSCATAAATAPRAGQTPGSSLFSWCELPRFALDASAG